MRLFLVAGKATERTLLLPRPLTEYTSTHLAGAYISQWLCPWPTVPACLGIALCPSMPRGITELCWSYRGGAGRDERIRVILESPKWQRAEDTEAVASCGFFRAVI